MSRNSRQSAESIGTPGVRILVELLSASQLLCSMMRRAFLLTALLICLTCVFSQAAQPHVDRVVVLKKERTLILYSNGQELKRYKVALGGHPVEPKQQQGDSRTPEGLYVLDSRNANSHFYKSIHISYPNAADRERARKAGVNPGANIFLHGLPNGFGAIGAAHRLKDWTDGCIAVTDEEIDEIWRLVPNGTLIEIRP
jgi:murein L,D-transpeptidase YafK